MIHFHKYRPLFRPSQFGAFEFTCLECIKCGKNKLKTRFV